MIYIQITEKCNMSCAHCCFACDMDGKHADIFVVNQAIDYAIEQGYESISIGGGEPTLHPHFFPILSYCLDNFKYVWLATNGSQTEVMHRLYNILMGCDYESFGRDDYCTYDEDEDYCTCDEDEDYCTCWPHRECRPRLDIYQEDKLTVALSTDPYHAVTEIDDLTWDRWHKNQRQPGFEIRDVTKGHHSVIPQGVIPQGRAKENAHWLHINDEPTCVCNSIIAKIDGTLRLCGCDDSPVIGNTLTGIEDHWQEKMDRSEGYQDALCHKNL